MCSPLSLGSRALILFVVQVATVQSLSGTGSLRLGAAFLARFYPGATVYLSNPTWGNHKNIFADAGVEWKEYRYFNPETVGLDFEGMMADIEVIEGNETMY
jgi:aspartate aminotransferase